MTHGHHPRTVAWASLNLRMKVYRLGWEIVRALKINHLFGVPVGGTATVDQPGCCAENAAPNLRIVQ